MLYKLNMRKTHIILILFIALVSCKDSDGDKVYDKNDECPNEFGLVEHKGCPDSDGDEIPDHLDECPEEYGLEEFKGCPDTDKDGIPDHKDDCPTEHGKDEFNGCPDSDNDEIPDAIDNCPNEYGYKSYNGCSDYSEMPMLVSECLENYNFTSQEVKTTLSNLNITLNSKINGDLCNSLIEILKDRRDFYESKQSKPYELDGKSKQKEINDGYIQAVYNQGNRNQYMVVLKDGNTNPMFYLMQVISGGKCNTGGTTKFDETNYNIQQIWVRHEAFKVNATLFTVRLLKSSKEPFDFSKEF